VESLGGLISCIKSGFIQDEIEKSRKVKEADISQRRLIMLGTNQFPNLQEVMASEIKAVPHCDESVSTYKKLIPFRAAAGFEQLRLATEKYVKDGNSKPKVFLFTMGNLAMLRARAGFATNFFGCAGYEIIDNPGFTTVDEGIRAAQEARAEIVAICSSDEEYADIVPQIAAGFKDSGATPFLVVAGYPKENIEQFRTLGVREFIHVRSDLYHSLLAFQQYLGIMEK
jgi:methylmalonyl-CoA mutase